MSQANTQIHSHEAVLNRLLDLKNSCEDLLSVNTFQIYARMRTHTHTNANTYTYTYTHTRTHTNMLVRHTIRNRCIIQRKREHTLSHTDSPPSLCFIPIPALAHARQTHTYRWSLLAMSRVSDKYASCNVSSCSPLIACCKKTLCKKKNTKNVTGRRKEESKHFLLIPEINPICNFDF